MRRIARCCLLLLVLLPTLGQADYLLVRRAATIRAEPTGSAEVLSKQLPGATLRLLKGDTQIGYYLVTDPETSRPGWIYRTLVRRYPDEDPAPPVRVSPVTPAPPVDCAAKGPLRVHFYDVGQALAALVDLPDGRHVLVDTGDSPTRAGCGAICKEKHAHLLDRLAKDLNGEPISMLWVTHQHSDHLGGALDVLNEFRVEVYVDNGLDLEKPQVKNARKAAADRSTRVIVVSPSKTSSPIPDCGAALQLRPIVPRDDWPMTCDDDANACSIGLRIDYRDSSILFTGDATDDEEAQLEPGGHVTLLQVGHHGSNTSSSPDFLAMTSPKYAVISAGKKDEGLNKGYCHPLAVTVEKLVSTLGGPTASSPLLSFDGSVKCKKAKGSNWRNIPSSKRLWATPRDGDVTLMTNGDGNFEPVRQ